MAGEFAAMKEWGEAEARWDQIGLLHGIEHKQQRQVAAVLLENQRLYNESLPEPREPLHVFTATSIPLARRVANGWFLHRLVSVQPLIQPQGLIYYGRFDGKPNSEVQVSRLRKLKAKPPAVRGQFNPKNEQQLHQLSEIVQLVAEQTIREVTSEVLTDVRNNPGLTGSCTLEQLPNMIVQTHERMAERLQAEPLVWFVGSAEMAKALNVENVRQLSSSYQEGEFAGRPFFIDPLFPTQELLMGHRGSEWWDAGYYFCPYLLFVHSPVDLSMMAQQLNGRKQDEPFLGIRYAKKMFTGQTGVYPKGVAYYAKLTVTDVQKAPDPDEVPEVVSLDVGGDAGKVVEELGTVKPTTPDVEADVAAEAREAAAKQLTHDADAVAEDVVETKAALAKRLALLREEESATAPGSES